MSVIKEEYININKIAELKWLKSNRSLRIAIQKGKYVAREITVPGGTSYEIFKNFVFSCISVSKRDENLRPLMKNIAGIFASSTEDNFREEGRPSKWTELSDITKKKRTKINKWPEQILQVEGMLAASINTQYNDDSAVIGSNLPYARIHQLGGQAGKNRSVNIPARPYLKLTDDDFEEILDTTKKFLK